MEKKNNKKGGYASLKAVIGAAGLTGATGLATLGSKTTYTAPKEEERKLPNINKIRESIADNETGIIKDGEEYDYSRYSGREDLGMAMGKYQVTEGELKTYAPVYLGRTVTPKDFQNSSALQEEYITAKIKYLIDKGYTPQQIADIHNKGMTNSSSPGDTKYQSNDYVDKFNKTYLSDI